MVYFSDFFPNITRLNFFKMNFRITAAYLLTWAIFIKCEEGKIILEDNSEILFLIV